MVRFSLPDRRGPAAGRRSGGPPVGGLLKLAALGCGLLLVVTAQQRLQTPEAHRALGRLIGQPETAALTPASFGPQLGEPAISAEQLATIEDNAPFSDEESDAWFALFDAASKRQPTAAPLVTYGQLRGQPDTYRGRPVQVRGTIRRVEAVTPADNDQGVTALYRLVLQDEGGNVWPTIVYTLEKPTGKTPFDASIVGYFFKNLSYQYDEGVGVAPIVIAKAVGKAPADEDAATAQPPPVKTPAEPIDFAANAGSDSLGRSLLAQLGVDPASLDVVQDRRRFSAEERGPFYAMLEAASRTPPSQLVRLAMMGLPSYLEREGIAKTKAVRDRQIAREVQRRGEERAYSVAPLFGAQHSLRGELMVFDAVVRRVVWVQGDASTPIDGYYELHAFPPDSQNLPLVFCMLRVPVGFPIGDDVRQPARLAGFFLKQWAYSTRRVTADNPNKDRRQFAPLFVGHAPIPLATPDATDRRPGWLVGIAGGSLLAGTAVALLLAWRGDRRYEASTLARYRRRAADGVRADAPIEGN